jgi:hypothetical protein
MSIADPFDDEDHRKAVMDGRVPPATIAQFLYKQGFDKGIREVLEESGRAVLRDLLLRKFQALDAASEACLQAASSEEIDRYLDRLWTAGSLAAVFED